jgi:hypothetical protein
MKKAGSSSWMPKGKSHQAAGGDGRASPKEVHASPSKTAPPRAFASGIDDHFRGSQATQRYSLPNGGTLTSVRRDIMDRALGRGDFKK